MSKSNQEPGPGKYTAKINFSTHQQPSYSIAGGKLEKKGPAPKSDAPGPGQYQSRFIEKDGKVSFGKDKRKGLVNNTWQPGPGAYDKNSELAGSSYGFGKGKRPDLGAAPGAVATPGPGHYRMPGTVG